jgi:protoporphyrinogen oxidase
MRAIDERLALAPGLFVSASGFRGVGIADCVANAQATARRVLVHLHASAN